MFLHLLDEFGRTQHRHPGFFSFYPIKAIPHLVENQRHRQVPTEKHLPICKLSWLLEGSREYNTCTCIATNAFCVCVLKKMLLAMINVVKDAIKKPFVNIYLEFIFIIFPPDSHKNIGGVKVRAAVKQLPQSAFADVKILPFNCNFL